MPSFLVILSPVNPLLEDRRLGHDLKLIEQHVFLLYDVHLDVVPQPAHCPVLPVHHHRRPLVPLDLLVGSRDLVRVYWLGRLVPPDVLQRRHEGPVAQHLDEHLCCLGCEEVAQLSVGSSFVIRYRYAERLREDRTLIEGFRIEGLQSDTSF